MEEKLKTTELVAEQSFKERKRTAEDEAEKSRIKEEWQSIFSNRLIYATQLNCTEIQRQKMYKDDKKT